MPDTAPTDPLEAAHCWSCGYPLRGVPSDRCPECGRPFDRADCSTINFGRPMGRVGRRALAGMSRWTVGIAIVGAGLVASTFRWPVEPIPASWADLRYYARVWEWKTRPVAPTWVDGAYTVGLAMVGIAIFAMLLRLIARGLAVWRYRPPAWQRGAVWRRVGVVVVAVIVTIGAVLYGWPYRVGQRWAADAQSLERQILNAIRGAQQPQLNLPPVRTTVRVPDGGTLIIGGQRIPAAPATPGPADSGILAGLGDEQLSAAARALTVYGRTPTDRTWGLKFLIERDPDAARAFLPVAYAREADPALRAIVLGLIGLTGRVADRPLIVAALDDPRPEIRAGAADAVGLSYRRAVDPAHVRQGMLHVGTTTATDPPIDGIEELQDLTDWERTARPADRAAGGLPEDVRQKLERMMTAGPTAAERESAARVLTVWPAKDYKLRVAQWAVLFADSNDRLRMAADVKRQIESIPPFVHRVGNPDLDFLSRIDAAPMPTFKPVAHFQVDRPMAVRFEVGFRGGRPWFAYPRPDDLAFVGDWNGDPNVAAEIGIEPTGGPLASLSMRDVQRRNSVWPALATRPLRLPDGPELSVLADLREGYPWLSPSHRVLRVGYDHNGDPGYHCGVLWQSLIVSPTKLAWMAPSPVPADQRYGWWDGLRTVDAAWVASRGEADRLLYFDGPVGARSPVRFEVRNGGVVAGGWHAFPEFGAFVMVERAGSEIRTAVVTAPARRTDRPSEWIQVGALPVATDAAAAEAVLVDVLRQRGLRADEAAGLMAAWRDVFYRPGRRALVLLSGGQYDYVFPHTITPQPTESVRVGIVVHELPLK